MPVSGSISLVPTVHFSTTTSHRRKVRASLREADPDLVAVELDEYRFDRLERDATRASADLVNELPPPTAAAYGLLKTMQRSSVRLYGLDPDRTDMEAAIETAAELDTEIALIDDPVQETVSALTDRVGIETLPKLLERLQRQSLREQVRQVEELTIPFDEIENGDDVQPAVDQLRDLLPEVTRVLIDRRDRAMARRLHRLRREGQNVVAVIGAGHHNGIEQSLDELEGRSADPEVAVPVRATAREVTKIPIN